MTNGNLLCNIGVIKETHSLYNAGKLPAPTKLTTTSEEPTNTCLAIVPYKAVYDEPAKQAKDKTAASETRVCHMLIMCVCVFFFI